MRLQEQHVHIVREYFFCVCGIEDKQLFGISHHQTFEHAMNTTINDSRCFAGTAWGGSSLLKVQNVLIKQKITYSSPVMHVPYSRLPDERLLRLIARSLSLGLDISRATSSALVFTHACHLLASILTMVEAYRNILFFAFRCIMKEIR